MTHSLNTCKTIVQDVFKVFKTHYGTEFDGQVVLDEFIAVCNKYPESEFCLAMAVAMNDQLMRRWNENHGTK